MNVSETIWALEISIDSNSAFVPEKPVIPYLPMTHDILTIGSSPYAGIYLPCPTLAKHHAQIQKNHSNYFLTALIDTPKILLNGAVESVNKKSKLSIGDTIQIESFIIRVCEHNPEKDETITESGRIQESVRIARKASEKFIAEVVRSTETDPSNPHFEFRAEGDNRGIWLLSEPGKNYTIGRHETCDLILPLPDVSRKHAQIRRDWDDRIYINDMGSANGVNVNRQRITRETELQSGDIVEIGGAVLTFKTQESAELLPALEPEVSSGGKSKELTNSAQIQPQSDLKPKEIIDVSHRELILIASGIIVIIVTAVLFVWLLAN